jgi:hypothetical protein
MSIFERDAWTLSELIACHTGWRTTSFAKASSIRCCSIDLLKEAIIGPSAGRPIWTLMVGLKSPLEVRGRVLINEGASMQLAVNLTAYQRDTSLPLTRSEHPQDVEEVWMVVSSFGFAARNSGPTLSAEGLELLLCELKMTVGADSLNICHAEPLRYETAIPSNCLSHGACLFDPKSRLGACGAWASKPCMQGAALSAMELADLVI